MCWKALSFSSVREEEENEWGVLGLCSDIYGLGACWLRCFDVFGKRQGLEARVVVISS